MKNFILTLALVYSEVAANQDWYDGLTNENLRMYGFDRDEFNEVLQSQ